MAAPTADLGIELPESTYPKPQVERAVVMNEVLAQKGIEKVDLVAHSEGGLNGTIAAAQQPDRFRHFVLVAQPGVTDTQSYVEIVKRAIRNKKFTDTDKDEAAPERLSRHERSEQEIKGWVKDRGVVKGTIESMNPGRVDVSDEVRELHGIGHGVSIVAGADDEMLPMKEYQRDKAGAGRSADSLGVDGFYSVASGHAEMEINGEEYGYLANSALDALIQKYQPSDTL